MIGNPETLREFIAGLYHRFRPVLIERYKAWSKYAEKEEGITTFGQLRTCDLFYICRREAEYFFGVDMLDVMNYFPAWPTFEKILSVIQLFLGIDFKLTYIFKLDYYDWNKYRTYVYWCGSRYTFICYMDLLFFSLC
jgi:Zn-dependent oligopeptidase